MGMYMAEMETEKESRHYENIISAAKEQPGVTIHIGSIIQTELKRQGRTAAWLSTSIHCDRRNIYDIFKRDTIDTSLLMRISNALGVDFFKIFSDALANETRK